MAFHCLIDFAKSRRFRRLKKLLATLTFPTARPLARHLADPFPVFTVLQPDHLLGEMRLELDPYDTKGFS